MDSPGNDNPDYAGPEGNRLRQEAQLYAEKRGKLFTESKQAYESGDKAKAKELSEEGKLAGKKMEEYNQKAAEVILKYRNDGHPINYLDLHGLYLEEALHAFHERLELLQHDTTNPTMNEIIFEVIPGAGNHSKNKAIIKPKIIEELQKRKLNYEEKNAGTLLVHVPIIKSGKSKSSEVKQASNTNSTGQTTDTTSPSSPSPSMFGCCIVM